MPDDLYERDILLWSERETALLRRIARGETVNEPVDWSHVIEELEGVGRAELLAVESLLEQAMVHLLKLRIDPTSPATRHWRAEILAMLGGVRRRYAPSMRHRIATEAIWHDAVRQVEALYPGASVPALCPWSIDELTGEEPDPSALAARISV